MSDAYRGMTLTCPRCLRQLEERKAKGALIHGCPSCGGVLLDKAQTDTVFQRMPGALALVTASNQAARASEAQRPRTDGTAPCPVCAEGMVLCEAEDIRIDQCAAHGTWFDANELRRIANAEAYREENVRATSQMTASRKPSDDEKPDLLDWITGFFDALDEADRRRY